MFRKPESDDEDDYGTGRLVKAKPISEKHMKKLGSAYQSKDFVVGSSKSQAQFYGKQEVRRDEEEERGPKPLTEDERNKISAKILKAELKGDKDLVNKLKRKLESGVSDEKEEKSVIMMKRTREGNVLPANKRSNDLDRHAPSSSRMQREYGKQQELSEMLREEKATSAEDQLRLFENSLVKSSKIRRHDDESIDDIAEMQKGRRKTDEKKERKQEKSMKQDSYFAPFDVANVIAIIENHHAESFVKFS
ncbi:hypothetical protein WR25_08707 [Diploscapter pachys]|uniref:Uncharacterized protein n=1 Tax=Diploscapter pachys TaxID=2018661 RepID=A0A2A2LM95_9BILA|nr:hypothetical protein WR25_08707 [Diploscapter pachys]